MVMLAINIVVLKHDEQGFLIKSAWKKILTRVLK